MGHGIAHAAASSGYATRLYDVSATQVQAGRDQIQRVFAQAVERGKASANDVDAALARVSTTTDLASALAGTDFVIEAAPERMDLKLGLFAEIERHAPQSA